MIRFGEVFKGLRWSVIADAVVLLVAVLVTVVAPKYLGVTEYGYWQLYLFYGAYVQLAQLGWADGLLLRKAGQDWEDVDAEQLTWQVNLQFAASAVGAIVLLFVAASLDGEARFICIGLALNVLISNARFMFLRLFQATRKMRSYAVNTMVDRLIYGALVIGLLVGGTGHFELLVIGSLIARSAALVLAILSARSVLRFSRPKKSDLSEAKSNVSAGIKTLVAVLAGSFVVGAVRLIVERAWGVEVFANVSLGLNLSGLVSVFVSGLSLALLPFLRRISEATARAIYVPVRTLVGVVLLGTLLLYYPARWLFSEWFPEYDLGLAVLYLLFPIVVFDGRTSLLTTTYLRSARKEGLLLWVNLGSMLLSGALGLVAAFVFRDLNLTIGIILLAVMLRSIVLEAFLARHLELPVGLLSVLDIVVTAVFLLSAGSLDAIGVLPIAGAWLAYVGFFRGAIRDGLGVMVKAMRR